MSESRFGSAYFDVGTVLDARLRALFAGGWHIISGRERPPGRADLIVRDAACVGPIVRDGAGRYAAMVVTADTSVPLDPAIDDVLPACPTPDDLAALAARWTPSATPALDRLSIAFGVAKVARLAAGLRDQLDDVIPALARGAEVDAAHRLAGLSGMLGFADLGRQWAALADRETVDRRALRIATRQAIVALDRFVTGAACPACAPACDDGDPIAAPPPRC